MATNTDPQAINTNKGTVISISANKTNIKIKTKRGGTFTCRNEGFELGEKVCFILDGIGQNVLKVIPEEVAELKWTLGQDALLKTALMEPLLEEEENVLLNPIFEEVLKDDDEYPEDEIGDSDGPKDEIHSDLCCGEDGELSGDREIETGSQDTD